MTTTVKHWHSLDGGATLVMDTEFRRAGVAVCMPGEAFDERTGRAIAGARLDAARAMPTENPLVFVVAVPHCRDGRAKDLRAGVLRYLIERELAEPGGATILKIFEVRVDAGAGRREHGPDYCTKCGRTVEELQLDPASQSKTVLTIRVGGELFCWRCIEALPRPEVPPAPTIKRSKPTPKPEVPDTDALDAALDLLAIAASRLIQTAEGLADVVRGEKADGRKA